MAKCFVLGAILLGLFFGGCATEHGQPLATQDPPSRRFAFALIGDTGYRPEQEPWVENLLTELNSRPLAFIVHVGDLGAPRFGSCTDEFRARRLVQFQASAHPLVLTPGDNDWTDCHEKGGAPGYDPLERLAMLRTVFFKGEQSLGQRTIPLTRQSQTTDPVLSKYRENVRWTYGGITFVTLHIVGSNNALGRTPEGDAEHAERNNANLAWLRQGFEHARANQSRAIMIMQQANIFPELPPLPALLGEQPSGFTNIRALLEQETIAFGKPVVLVHGDSHFFRIDKPFGARLGRDVTVPTLENFTRVETFGAPNHHWVHVTVDVDDPNVLTFQQRIVAPNVVRRR
jgi:hypothetical protein